MRNYKKIIMLIGLLVAVATFVLWVCWGNTALQVTQYEIKSPRISEKLSGFTVVQVSDLHNQAFGENQVQLLAEIKSAKPDVIAVTGDLIDSNRAGMDAAMAFIVRAVELAPVYYVTGNHESRTAEYEELRLRMIRAGVHMMDGKVEEVSYHGASIYLMGVADPEFWKRFKKLKDAEIMQEALRSLSYDDSMYTILLSHRPELFDTYVAGKLDLVLTGHAHGGQIRLPFIGGLLVPNQGLFPKYTSGVFSENNTRMVISRGLGNSRFPFRINNRPELVVVTLQAETS